MEFLLLAFLEVGDGKHAGHLRLSTVVEIQADVSPRARHCTRATNPGQSRRLIRNSRNVA